MSGHRALRRQSAYASGTMSRARDRIRLLPMKVVQDWMISRYNDHHRRKRSPHLVRQNCGGWMRHDHRRLTIPQKQLIIRQHYLLCSLSLRPRQPLLQRRKRSNASHKRLLKRPQSMSLRRAKWRSMKITMTVPTISRQRNRKVREAVPRYQLAARHRRSLLLLSSSSLSLERIMICLRT